MQASNLGMKRARHQFDLEYYNVFQGIKASMQDTQANLNLSLCTVAISKRAHTCKSRLTIQKV